MSVRRASPLSSEAGHSGTISFDISWNTNKPYAYILRKPPLNQTVKKSDNEDFRLQISSFHDAVYIDNHRYPHNSNKKEYSTSRMCMPN